jgi:hypothetical protein
MKRGRQAQRSQSMKHLVSLVVAALALPAWADCTALDAEIARVEQARRAAIEQNDNAWKAVVPFVVLARKASAKSALEDADKRLAELKAQAQAQRCAAADDAQ